MTLPAPREQETTQQPGDIIVGAPAASKVSMPPSDPTQMVNRQLVPAAGTYQIDPAHTFVDFTAQHLVVGHVRGRFTQLAGQITVAEDLTRSATSVTITAASIDTHVAKRDNDLRSARYLDTDTYPAITFASTLLTEYPGNRWGLEGDLTIKDITRPVELLTEFTGSAIDNLGNAKVAFLAQARISRHDFGLTHELRNEAGSLLVRRDVTLCFAVEAIRTQHSSALSAGRGSRLFKRSLDAVRTPTWCPRPQTGHTAARHRGRNDFGPTTTARSTRQ